MRGPLTAAVKFTGWLSSLRLSVPTVLLRRGLEHPPGVSSPPPSRHSGPGNVSHNADTEAQQREAREHRFWFVVLIRPLSLGHLLLFPPREGRGLAPSRVWVVPVSLWDVTSQQLREALNVSDYDLRW